MPKNFRKIPDQILKRLETFALDDVVAACVKRISPGDIKKYGHLGVEIRDGELVLPDPFVPDPRTGIFSSINVHGKEVKRKDLPKVIKTFSFYAPNWGDYSNGEHLVSHDREVYRVDFIPPKEVELSISSVGMRGQDYLLKFAIEESLNKHSPDFQGELLYNLNVLQENVGSIDVFESEATLADYQASIKLDWEILPVGTLPASEVASQILRRAKAPTREQVETVVARLEVFRRFSPTNYIAGTSGFTRYFGAMYGDDFVVFENIRYGNALYVMFKDWRELSKKSRIDLLKGEMDGFERIPHNEGWERRLEAMIEAYRGY